MKPRYFIDKGDARLPGPRLCLCPSALLGPVHARRRRRVNHWRLELYRPTDIAKTTIAVLAVWSALVSVAIAQAGSSVKRLTSEEVKVLLEDADSVRRITAEAKLFNDATPITVNWKGSQSASLAFANRGEFRQAVRAAGISLFLGEKEQVGEPALAFAKADLARAYSYAGNLDLAEKFAIEALGHNAGQWYYRYVRVVANKALADVATRRGNQAKAVAHYQEAYKYVDADSAIGLRVGLANALMLGGKSSDAQAIFDEIKSHSTSPIREMIQRLGGELALRQGNHDEAITRFRRYGQGATGDDGAYHRVWALDGEARALLAKEDRKSAVEKLLEATATADGLRARFYSEEFRTGLFGEMEAVFARTVIALIESGDHQRAFDIAEASRARALSDQVRGRVSADLPMKTLPIAGAGKYSDVSSLIGTANTLVVYYVAGQQTIAWVQDQSGLRAVKLAVTQDQLRMDVQRMRSAIVERSPQVREHGARLHDALIKPLGLSAGKGLIIIPHDALHHLPFQALWNGEHYLIQSHAISYAPSLDSLVHIVRTRDVVRQIKIVAFGNPDLGSESFALPGAEREINNIKAAYPDTLAFFRGDATKSRFVAEAPRHATVHIAAHAEFDALDPLYSRVRLAPERGIDGAVEAHEIYRLNFAGTSLVTLSACESGMSRITKGDEIWGFTRSFLSAGASALVLSLWPVADESTEKIMTTFYNEMRGASLREAMRKAQLALRNDSRFEHPYFWAPFNIIGDWR